MTDEFSTTNLAHKSLPVEGESHTGFGEGCESAFATRLALAKAAKTLVSKAKIAVSREYRTPLSVSVREKSSTANLVHQLRQCAQLHGEFWERMVKQQQQECSIKMNSTCCSSGSSAHPHF